MLTAAAILAVVVVVLCWWLKPDRDPRLVGKWEIAGTATGECEFRADGAMVLFSWCDGPNVSPNGANFMEFSAFSWRTSGNKLIIESSLPELRSLHDVGSFVESLWRRYRDPYAARLQIVELTPDEMTLRGRPQQAQLEATNRYRRLIR